MDDTKLDYNDPYVRDIIGEEYAKRNDLDYNDPYVKGAINENFRQVADALLGPREQNKGFWNEPMSAKEYAQEFVEKPANSFLASLKRIGAEVGPSYATGLGYDLTDEDIEQNKRDIDAARQEKRDNAPSPDLGMIGRFGRGAADIMPWIASSMAPGVGPVMEVGMIVDSFLQGKDGALERGIDESTANKIGIKNAITTTALMKTPMSAGSYLKSAARGAGVNVGIEIAGEYAEKGLLNSAGYDKEAEAINPWELGEGKGQSAAMGVLFGVHQHYGMKGAAKKLAADLDTYLDNGGSHDHAADIVNNSGLHKDLKSPILDAINKRKIADAKDVDQAINGFNGVVESEGWSEWEKQAHLDFANNRLNALEELGDNIHPDNIEERDFLRMFSDNHDELAKRYEFPPKVPSPHIDTEWNRQSAAASSYNKKRNDSRTAELNAEMDRLVNEYRGEDSQAESKPGWLHTSPVDQGDAADWYKQAAESRAYNQERNASDPSEGLGWIHSKTPAEVKTMYQNGIMDKLVDEYQNGGPGWIHTGDAVDKSQPFTMRNPEDVYSPYSPEVAAQANQKALPAPERGFTARNPEDVYSPYSPELAEQTKSESETLMLPPGSTPRRSRMYELLKSRQSEVEKNRNLESLEGNSVRPVTEENSVLSKQTDLTPEQKRAEKQAMYQELFENADYEAERKKLQEKYAKELTDEIVNSDPVYQHMAEARRRGGIDLSSFGVDYDKDTINLINKRYPGIFSKNGKVAADDFAGEMGYSSLDDMVQKFSSAKTKKELNAQHSEEANHLDEVGKELQKISDNLGIDLNAPEKVNVGDLNKGDKVVVIDRNGMPDVVTHMGDENGQAVLKDGITIHADPWDQVDSLGVKRGDEYDEISGKPQERGAVADAVEGGVAQEETSAPDESTVKFSKADTDSSEPKYKFIPDKTGKTVAPKYSIRSWTEQEKSEVISTARRFGISEKKAKKWIKDIDNVMAIILNDPSLDFDATAAGLYSALKANSDPHYSKSLDFSTLCRKRYVLMATIEKIQLETGRAVDKDNWSKIRQMLKDKGFPVSCGACYVDSKRMEQGKFINQFLDAHPEVDPHQVLTQRGIDEMKRTNPELYKEFKKKVGSNNSKTTESRVDYFGEIRTFFGDPKRGEQRVLAFNGRSGLRWQSWSDFEVPHLMDAMQAILDMSLVKLKGHAYTKVEEFVDAMGKTGLMINVSLIPKGNGFDANGKLAFDPVEGMSFDKALEFREKYPNTVGTIAIGISNEHIKALLADPRIDYVIPYHASGLAKRFQKEFGMGSWEEYTKTQTASIGDVQKFHDTVGKDYPLLKKYVDENGSVVDAKGYIKTARAKDYIEPDFSEYWSDKRSGKENGDKYLQMMEDRGALPKFRGHQYKGKRFLDDFTKDENYWKLLIDRKSYDNDGNPIVQKPVRPEYDNEAIKKIYSEYKAAPDQADQGTVDHFLKMYKGPKKSEGEGVLGESSDIHTELADNLGGGWKGKLRVSNLLKKNTVVLDSQDAAKDLIKSLGGMLSAAWHGSPHRDIDKSGFSTKHIGTGEGAQAYGWGMYFAGSKDVAEWYRKNLTKSEISYAGAKLSDKTRDASKQQLFKTLYWLVEDSRSSGLPLEEARLKRISEKEAAVLDAEKRGATWLVGGEGVESAKADISRLKSIDTSKIKQGGQLYKVELAPKEDEYLLWDKPLSEQSEKVKEALSKSTAFDNFIKEYPEANPGGKWLYRDFFRQEVGSDKAASEYLHSLGIRGIKYLDGSSRGKGEGNHNYVIFHDNDVKITDVMYSKEGQIQGFTADGKIYLVKDGIQKGDAWRVFLHEVTHATRLGFKDSPEFNLILKSIEKRTELSTDEGAFYREARERALKAGTRPADIPEEILAYGVETDRSDISLVRRYIAMVKKALVQMGVSPDILSAEDFKALAINAARKASRISVSDAVKYSMGQVQEAAGAFYSKLEQVAGDKFTGMKAQSVMPFLLKQGVKKTEIEALGVQEWLAGMKPTDKVTKAQLADFVKANAVEYEDVVLGDDEKPFDRDADPTDRELMLDHHLEDYGGDQDAFDTAWENGEFDDRIRDVNDTPPGGTQFAPWQEPGGKEGSYREMFVTVPAAIKGKISALSSEYDHDEKKTYVSFEYEGETYGTYKENGESDLESAQRKIRDYEGIGNNKNWKDGHSQYSDIQNPIVRIRFNEVEGSDGKRILRIEEMQGPSDDNQFRMPKYLKENLYTIGVKRIIAYAKEHGFDGIALATKPGRSAGETQADRYSLEQQVENIVAARSIQDSGKYALEVDGKDGNPIFTGDVAEKDLVRHVGKELAEKIISQKGNTAHNYSGLDLKIGGEGLKRLYDIDLPRMLEAWGGEKMGQHILEQGGEFVNSDGELDERAQHSMPYLPITDKTPSSFPKFSKKDDPQFKAVDTNSPEFKRWFGGSKVVDENGKPLVVYRGEHGELKSDSGRTAPSVPTTDHGSSREEIGYGEFQSRLGALSFGSQEAASQYAENPNLYGEKAVAPRVFPVYLKIKNPVINTPDDPFVDGSTLINKLGRIEAVRILKKFANNVENTNNWHEINYDDQYHGVSDFLDKHPDRAEELYFDTFSWLDDKSEVGRLKKSGFDGAIHGGNGDTALETEYKVFDPNQVKSAISNTGDFSSTDPRIKFSIGNFTPSPENKYESIDPNDKLKSKTDRQLAGLYKFLNNPSYTSSDVIKAGENALSGWRQFIDGIKRVARPESRGDDAKATASTLREGQGNKARGMAQDKRKLDDAYENARGEVGKIAKLKDMFTSSSGVLADAVFNRMSVDENHAFITRFEKGEKQPTKILQAIDDSIREIFAQRVERVRALGTGALENVIENYFPHIWEKQLEPHQLQAILSRRPLDGGKAFLKKRVFDDIQAGLDAGYKLILNNPIDLVMLKLHEMDKYITAHEALQDMAKRGVVTLIPNGKEPPKGLEPIKGTYGMVMKKDGKSYRYHAADDVAQVFNNYLSPTLYNNKYVGQPFKFYMRMANLLNQFQLGVGSLFHVGFVTNEAMISHGAIGLRELARGNIKEAGKYFIKAPLAPVQYYKQGRDLMKSWASDGQLMPAIVSMLQQAGAIDHMDRRFMLDDAQKASQAWANDKYVKAAWHTPFAAVELMARPIMETLVPRMKFGAFAEMAGDFLKYNPTATPEQVKEASQQIWNRVESRLGQVAYDRLFVHNWAKNLTQALIRAPGWTGGTILEVGGGLTDTVKAFKDIATGKKPQMTDRMAYTASLLVYSALANGILTALFTGDKPEGKDFLAFRTGGQDENGNPSRYMLPTYMKDLFAYAHNFPSGMMTTLSNKTHPALSLVADVKRNRGYYGTEIRHEQDNPFAQVGQVMSYVGKAFVPFWIRGAQKAQERNAGPASLAASWVGIMPATSEITKSKSQSEMSEIYKKQHESDKALTREQSDKRQLRSNITRKFRLNDVSAQADLNQALSDGKLDQKDVKTIHRNSKMSQLESSFSHLRSLDDMIRVYEDGTDKEKSVFRPILMKKRKSISDLPPEQRERMERKFNEAIAN